MDYSGIILLVKNAGFKCAAPYDIEILGRKMKDWCGINLASDYVFVDYETSDDIVPIIKPHTSDKKYTVVLYSDTPLIQRNTILEAINHMDEKGLNVIKLVRGFVFNSEFLRDCEKLYAPETYYCGDDDFLSAPDFCQLALITEALRSRILNYHMQNGVYIINPATTYIDADTAISEGVTIYPNNTIRGKTVIEKGATLYEGNAITDTFIGENTKITSSNITGAEIGAGSTVGPYAYLRKGSLIGEGCRIGDFVEIKNAKIGKGTKVSHLSYVGDAEVGEGCNIGCGVVFVNYDGKKKFRSKVGNNVFLGSNTNVIAPVEIEEHAYIAAGSTINENVPARGLAIARARQVIKTDWNKDKF